MLFTRGRVYYLMMILNVYSKDFDSAENVVDRGFSGDAFVESEIAGERFHCHSDNLTEAIKYIVKNDIAIDTIMFNYVDDDGYQCFKKFNLC